MVIKYRPQTWSLPGRQTADMFVHRQQNEQKTKREKREGGKVQKRWLISRLRLRKNCFVVCKKKSKKKKV